MYAVRIYSCYVVYTSYMHTYCIHSLTYTMYFILFLQMSTVLTGTITEECFRAIYLSYAKVCKSYSEYQAPSVIIMIESIVQLYITNITHAYQQAFLYIRQLALHLRAAMMKKGSKDQHIQHIKHITTWQYLNCIRLWTSVLCALPSKNQLGNLFFPLTQVIIGVINNIQSIYYIPLKFHCITCLQQLAAYGQLFIPTSPKLTDLFDLGDLNQKSTPSTSPPPNLLYIIKLPNNSINIQIIKDLLINATISLIQYDSEIYKYNTGYPEYVYITIKKLRTFSKSTKNSIYRDLTRALACQLEDHSNWVKLHRVSYYWYTLIYIMYTSYVSTYILNYKLRLNTYLY